MFKLFTIAAENPFLTVLARAVLHGFPLARKQALLSRTTILVPNRRSARALEQVFLRESGVSALLLPCIKPIGDIDEDLIADSLPEEGVPDGISKTDHLHAILNLVMQWAKSRPQSELAQDVLGSGAQAFALAFSLQRLVNQFETEDASLDDLDSAYTLDLAGHRQSILDLLSVISRELPDVLSDQKVLGPSARRNRMIRLEAARIRAHAHKGPVIAAGSTGTNPATRDLLLAIAQDPMGAVVLPGLDLSLDEEAWNAITPEHPQFSLSTVLKQWGATRADVQTLGEPQGLRMWLMGEALRPAAVADQWAIRLAGQTELVQQALQGVELVEAPDRPREAELIALRLRQHIHESEGLAALITPDRDLAVRVKAALRRWNLTIDDSAGEPLVHHGRAALLLLLLHAVSSKFSSASLLALLHHPACHFGQERERHLHQARTLELAGFRGLPAAEGLSHLVERLVARKASVASNRHAHPVLKALTEEDWTAAMVLAAQLQASLSPLADAFERPLLEHVQRLLDALDFLSPPRETLSEADQNFADVMAALAEGSYWHPLLPLAKTQHAIIQALDRETLRPPLNPSARLAILGLAEARLVDVELAILGGLTEGTWPDHPDSGPWLNRPMRDAIKLQQPEREIGVTAHDFVQAFGHGQVILTWPAKNGGAPATPSRWVLRLQSVMKTVGLEPKAMLSMRLLDIAQRLDAPTGFNPRRRPVVAPPVDLRPTTFSVSRVEKLVRDSYWIYARNILKLQPLEEESGDIDASLRGLLVHEALQRWTSAMPVVPRAEHLHLLVAKGREVFQPYLDMPEVTRFWWPRFERMAADFIAGNAILTADTLGTRTELDGFHPFTVAGVAHHLTARADRIDITPDGALRIIDYKTGQLPSEKEVLSGFAPQLTLEAAIAKRQGFVGMASDQVEDVMYIGVGGGRKGVEFRSLAANKDVNAEAEKAFAALMALLAKFQLPTTAYIPRHNPQFEGGVTEYDHLSRHAEWQLEGSAL